MAVHYALSNTVPYHVTSRLLGRITHARKRGSNNSPDAINVIYVISPPYSCIPQQTTDTQLVWLMTNVNPADITQVFLLAKAEFLDNYQSES